MGDLFFEQEKHNTRTQKHGHSVDAEAYPIQELAALPDCGRAMRWVALTQLRASSVGLALERTFYYIRMHE